MKTSKLMIAAGAAMAFAVPALADTTTTTTPSAQQLCQTERAQMGKATFAEAYGTNKNHRNAFGKCVSQRSKATKKAQSDAQSNAAQQCKAERAGDPAAFKAKYGTGKNGKDAFGKCVSQQAGAQAGKTVSDETTADVNAAQQCKAERAADPAAFKAKYGSNKRKSNAFGKCVAQQASAHEHS
jgi:hypothetical protein